jgi:hypothetical protein
LTYSIFGCTLAGKMGKENLLECSYCHGNYDYEKQGLECPKCGAREPIFLPRTETKEVKTSTAKVCTLRNEMLREEGSLNTVAFVFQYKAYVGPETVAQSDEYKIARPVFFGDKSKADKDSALARETAYQQVLDKLFKNGWQPLGTDKDGRVMSFKKGV